MRDLRDFWKENRHGFPCLVQAFVLRVYEHEAENEAKRSKTTFLLRTDKVKVFVAQSCLTLCDPMGLLGSSVHGILQARILDWVAVSSSRGSS